MIMTADAVGGVWSYSLTLAGALHRLYGLEIALAVVGPAPSAAQVAEAGATPGIHLRAYPGLLEWQPGDPGDLERSSRRLGALARELGAPLIHSNQLAYGALDGPCPVLVAAHSDLLSWHAACQPLDGPIDPAWRAFLAGYRRVVARGLAGAAAVVAPSRSAAAGLRAYDAGGRAAAVIYNGVALPPPTRRGAATPRRALSAGRLWDPAKNLATTLDAVAGGIPGLTLSVAGPREGPDGAQAPDGSAGVRWLGALPHADLLAEMARSDVYVGMSRYEPFGLAPLEAAARGCALLLSDIPSFREIWGPAATYCRSAAELRAALERIAAGAPLQRARARRRAARYTIDRAAHAYYALYCRLAPELARHAAVFVVPPVLHARAEAASRPA